MISHMECCGLRELSELSNFNSSREALLGLIGTIQENDGENPGKWLFGVIIFTEAGRGTYATRFAKYIAAKRLGAVTAVPSFYNPNSGNQVRMFVWRINHAAVGRWANSTKKE